MFMERRRTLRGSHTLLDVLCIGAAFALAFVLRQFHMEIPLLKQIPATSWRWQDVYGTDYALLFAVSAAAWTYGLRNRRGYLVPHRGTLMQLIFLHFRGLAWAVLATSAAVFTVKLATVSRLYFGYFFSVGCILLLGKDLFMRSFIRRLSATPLFSRHALVIASGKPASWFGQALHDASDAGYTAVGVIWSGEGEPPEDIGSLPVLGGISDLDSVLIAHPVDEVFVVGGAHQLASLAPVVQRLTERGRVVSMVSTLQGGGHGVRGRVTEFEGIPMLSWGPMPKDEVGATVKRAMDVTVAALALVLFAPAMAIVTVLLKSIDPGPVLFAQHRLGVGGEHFLLYKFRSMRVDAEEALRRDPVLYQRYVDNDFKLPESEDPRISPLGRFLRKSSLDELPQLINVLRGDMSMVGPRPIVPDEIAHYRPYSELFLSVRPGITGLWQVSGRSDVRYPERAFMDLDYIGNNSVLQDIIILVKTVPAVLARKGAH
ncbi:MAG: sugar transferase [Myxococcales bacterium]|nr:sugar transferase [Myxococcales bacterium]